MQHLQDCVNRNRLDVETNLNRQVLALEQKIDCKLLKQSETIAEIKMGNDQDGRISKLEDDMNEIKVEFQVRT